MNLAIAAAAATGVQVGAAIVATRYVVDQLGPASLGFLRYLLAIALLAPVVIARRRLRFAARDVAPIAVLGIAQFGVLIAFLNYALQHISSARAALIFATVPLLTMLLAAALGRERLSLRKSAGVLVTIAGVALALGDDAFAARDAAGQWLGAGAAFASAATGAACAVFYRPYLDRYPALEVSALAMAASVVFLALLSTTEGLAAGIAAVTPVGWAAVAFIGVSSGVGYFLWLYALGNAPPTQVTAFLGLGPPTAAILGAWLLDEALTAGVLAGLACVVAGLAIALSRPA